jgi:hypothetical protein
VQTARPDGNGRRRREYRRITDSNRALILTEWDYKDGRLRPIANKWSAGIEVDGSK